jgi:hypothetical protein
VKPVDPYSPSLIAGAGEDFEPGVKAYYYFIRFGLPLLSVDSKNIGPARRWSWWAIKPYMYSHENFEKDQTQTRNPFTGLLNNEDLLLIRDEPVVVLASVLT